MLGIIHHRPISLASGDVGMERAVDLLEHGGRSVRWLNTALLEGAKPSHPGELCAFLEAHFGHVIVKSNWDYVVDRFVRRWLWTSSGDACRLTRSLQIAGSYPPPRATEAVRFYDALFYESNWYAPFLAGMPRTFHAFGVDADAMAKQCAIARSNSTEVLFDYLVVGAFADHAGFKRPTLLARKAGRRLAMGKYRDDGGHTSEKAAEVKATLEEAGVETREPVPWRELGAHLTRAAVVYVPDDWRGGGERIVLEARACGVEVEVEHDNPKLRSMLTGPLYTPLYYAGQLEAGMLAVEAALAAALSSSSSASYTCGIQAFLSAGHHCSSSDDRFMAKVDVNAPLPLNVVLQGEGLLG